MTSAVPARGRPRRPETDRRILDAARALLRESGPTAVTIEAVAARSGVARTTIYRRYSDRRELITAALEQLVAGPFPAPELPMERKLRWVLEQVSELVEQGIGRGGAGAALADVDPEFTLVLRDLLAARLGRLRGLMEDDLASGALREGVDPEVLVSLLFGAYVGEALRHEVPREGQLDQVARLVAGAVTPPTEPPAPSEG